MKKVKIVVATAYQLYFASEVEVQCHNMRKYGYSSLLHVLIYEGAYSGPEEEKAHDRFKEYWDKLAERYPEVKFFHYKMDNLKNLVKVYSSVSRPYILKKHWENNPELEDHVIIYLDSDVLFTRHFDFSKYINGDVCYMSRTDYLDANYFKSKRKDVIPYKLQEYDTRDILDEFCKIVGIDKQIVENNIDNTGGAQYVLKGIDAKFWEDVANDCMSIFTYSKAVNQRFFFNEDKGFQSWALGDMCGLLWNLWKRGIKTQCPEELGFSWADGKIDIYDKYPFFHNAGALKKYQVIDGIEHKFFCKSDIRFRTNTLTFFDLEYDGITKDYCTYKYVEAIKEVPNPICRTNTTIY